MKYAIIEDGVVTSILGEFDKRAVEAPDDLVYGDHYKDGEWIRDSFRQEVVLTAVEKREQAYETMRYKEDDTALITWQDSAITVDQANKKWLDYSAEGNTVANELSALIVSAKGYIRELYPDE